MRRLPLYAGGQWAGSALDASPVLDLDSGCARCEMREGARNVCLPAEGGVGGVLVVLDSPSREDDAAARPAVGKMGAYVRTLLARLWAGPVALDHGVRCAPGAREVETEHLDACRPYLAQTFAEVQPSRVLTFGADAMQAVLGRRVPPLSARRGYGWTAEGVPVFILPSPMVALRNRIHRARIEEDVAWALTVDLATLVHPWAVQSFAEVVTAQGAADAVYALRQTGLSEWLVYDTETEGVMFDPTFRLLAVTVAVTGDGAVYGWGAAALADPALADPLRRLLEDEAVRKCGQNLKYDYHAVALGLGIRPGGHVGDTRLWRKMLESDVDARLEYQAELVGMGGHKEEAYREVAAGVKTIRAARAAHKKALAGVTPPPEHPGLWATPGLFHAVVTHPDTRPEQWAYGMVDPTVLLRYCARDTLTTAYLATLLEARVRAAPGVANAWDNVAAGATEAIGQIEAWGVLVDVAGLEDYARFLADEKAGCEQTFTQYPGFNPASVPSVRALLYETLGLPVLRTTDKDAPSTDEATLSLLSAKFPGQKVLRSLVTFRRLAKMEGTYAGGMRGHVRPDGRIHPTLKIDGTGTGRLSCGEPNLQNIPRVTPGVPWGTFPRAMFVAPPGHTFLQADYSQLELRVAAMLSGDEGMRAIFREGVDYHQRTAELIAPIAWGIPASQTTKEHRSMAKTVNFGVLYGMSAPALAARMGCRTAQAEAIVEALFGKFQRLRAWTRECLAHARSAGDAETWWAGRVARRRDLAAIGEADELKRGSAENSSWNTPVQGTASDFCLASVVEVVRWLREDAVPAKLVLTVHDSLLLEVRDDCIEEVASQVRRIMRSWPSEGVPLDVDLETGPTWGDLHHYETPIRATLRALGGDPNQADDA